MERNRKLEEEKDEEGSIFHREAGAKCELAVTPVVLPACRDGKFGLLLGKYGLVRHTFVAWGRLRITQVWFPSACSCV